MNYCEVKSESSNLLSDSYLVWQKKEKKKPLQAHRLAN